MKKFNKIALLGLSAIAMAGLVSCGDEIPNEQYLYGADVDFNYNVDGDEYLLDYYVVSTIQFNNTSAKTGSVHWDFGDGQSSTEPNPKHKFDSAGIYRVTLTIDGVGSKTYPILIYDIVPSLSVASQSTEVVEFNNTTVTFNIELPNPENLKVKYVWTFPEGTTDAEGNVMTTFTGYADANGNVEYPEAVKFSNIGSQRINISTWFDTDGENRRLEDTYLNVQVGTSEPAPTLYYASKGGNIKAYKLVDPASLPAGTKILPYDMGVSAGQMMQNIVYADVPNSEGENEGWIYLLDAGKQYYYINDENGVLGDGQITAMRTDGTGVNTVITNVGGAAFNDPFQGCVYNGYLYYSDRNTGVSRVALTARGEVQGQNSDHNRDNYEFYNTVLPFYGRGISYGAIHTGLLRDSSGYWWWGKTYNGQGIFRFKDSDVYKTQKEAESAALPSPVVYSNGMLKAYMIDEQRKALYIYRTEPTSQGFAEYPLPAITEGWMAATVTPSKMITLDADPINTTASEGVYVPQFALDKETGRVYFCYNSNTGDKSGIPTGVAYYDPTTKTVKHYGDANDIGLGICINPNKTKLF